MPRRHRSTWREVMWALVLTAVLSAGVVAVLLINTSMQQQAIRLDHEQQQMQQLTAHSQTLQAALARNSDPTVLATRARQLHMHPATTTRWSKDARASAH